MRDVIDGECANGFVVAGVVWVEMGCWECEGCGDDTGGRGGGAG